jgi:hypothetical protein
MSPRKKSPDKRSSVGITARTKRPTRARWNTFFDSKTLSIECYFTVTPALGEIEEKKYHTAAYEKRAAYTASP